MISYLLQTLEKGMRVMRSNSRMLLVAVLVFVFPLLFVWVTQSFFTTAYDNIHTAEKQRISIMHESIASVLRHSNDYQDLAQVLINKYTHEYPDVTHVRVVSKDENGFRILLSQEESLVGTYEKNDFLYQTLPPSAAQNSFIFESIIDGIRTWQVFRIVDTQTSEQFYIFTEHKFNLIDSVMSARRQQSYFGLTTIFLFLIALAYWLNRQVYWEKNHAKLAKQLKERDLFSNMIAHEFRSPLTAIKGYASFLEESKTLTKDEVRYATNIHRAAERLVALVNDFLEVARIQSGKLKLNKQKIDLRDVLDSVVADLQGLASAKDLALIYNKGNKPVHLDTDSDRMIQVLTNLVSNAIKYTDNGSVEISCSVIPGEVTIRIKDTGMGISAEDQQKLFSPFTRVGGVDSSSVTGTGLGMWITKQLITLLDGQIGVESIKGVGTHVVLTFKD